MSQRKALHTGGCQCGAVRYALYAEPLSISVCHCRMCQKALGNLFGPYAGVVEADMAWTRGHLKIFRSSSEATRGFCADCGTPLTFAFDKLDKISFTIGSFDDADRIVPIDQIEDATAVPYLADVAHLPARKGEKRFAVTKSAIAASNRQHPDHDTDHWPPHET